MMNWHGQYIFVHDDYRVFFFFSLKERILFKWRGKKSPVLWNILEFFCSCFENVQLCLFFCVQYFSFDSAISYILHCFLYVIFFPEQCLFFITSFFFFNLFLSTFTVLGYEQRFLKILVYLVKLMSNDVGCGLFLGGSRCAFIWNGKQCTAMIPLNATEAS